MLTEADLVSFADKLRIPWEHIISAENPSFYKDGSYIVRALINDREVTYVVDLDYYGWVFTVLDGSLNSLILANQGPSLELNEKTVLQFAAFLCNHRASSDGHYFRIIETAEIKKLQSGKLRTLQRPELKLIDLNGTYWIKAFLKWKDQIIRVSLRIEKNGKWRVARELNLGLLEGLPTVQAQGE